ncbi:hypothetical protein QLX08_011032 [Tetragonisca angustula]|uniref:Uncharacterized protein n=1 Tax=Tetragonisca angustula TaxID=166442 RepID=A0AAW0ZCQ0_9HYME
MFRILTQLNKLEPVAPNETARLQTGGPHVQQCNFTSHKLLPYIDFCESEKGGTNQLDFSQESGNTVFLSYISISGQAFHKRQWACKIIGTSR